MGDRALRIGIAGAFPFPVSQGSQVYAGDQARALAAAGAEVTLFCYGAGEPRATPELELVRTPRLLSPRRLRAGPSPRKPLADAALVQRIVAAQREHGFSALLAHNAEAALVGFAARARCGLPVVYVAHTVVGEELPAYGPGALARPLARLGHRLDALLARRADALLVLSRRAAVRLGEHAVGPLEVIPPGLDPCPPPPPAELAAACARHGLTPGAFVLYAGNVDRYQELALLDSAARALHQHAHVPVVVATHDARGLHARQLRVASVADASESRSLVHAAAVTVLPRRRAGGYPIKLLNYMEAARAIVAFAHVAEGLEHERSAWLLPERAGADALAAGIRALLERPELAARLGAAARSQLERRHAWPALAARTLALARAAGAARQASR